MPDPITYRALPEDLGGIEGEAIPEPARLDPQAATPNAATDGKNGVKNKLSDLNNHLFATLERLGEEGLTAEQVSLEVQRAEAIVSVSDQIVRNADLQLKAVTVLANHGERYRQHLPMLEGRE